ncbi:MAG: sulfatase-like hydrolase/transferase [Pseudomonadota bacterium]
MATTPANAQPNILYVIADDLLTNGLQTAPQFDPASHMPHLNALAAEGANFTRAYAPASQCQPARAALMSGLRPHDTGWTHNSWQKRKKFGGTKGDLFAVLGANTRTLARDLSDGGYTTATVGKVYHVFAKNPDPRAFDAFTRSRKGERGTQKTIYRQVKSGVTTTDFAGTRAAAVADQAVAWMNTLPEPWAVFVGIYPPHLPWMAPADTWAMVPETLGPLPGYLMGDREDTYSYSNNRLRRINEAQWQDSRRAQLVSSAHADETLGAVMSAFDRSDTVMVFVSDQGMCMGQRENYAAKATLAPCASQVPYVWAGAGIGGSTIDAPVDTMSIYPTLLNLAGIERPDRVAGTDLSALLQTGSEIATQALSSQGRRHALRWCDGASCWSYACDANGGKEEIYDLTSDPHEFVNLAPTGIEAARARMDAALAGDA